MNGSRVNLEILKKGGTIIGLLRELRLKEGIGRMTVQGHRHNREVQEKVAAALGIDARELWGSNYWIHFDGERRAS